MNTTDDICTTANRSACSPTNVDASLGAPVLHGEVELVRVAVIRFPSQILHGIDYLVGGVPSCALAFTTRTPDVQPDLQSLFLPMVVPGTLLVVLPFLQ